MEFENSGKDLSKIEKNIKIEDIENIKNSESNSIDSGFDELEEEQENSIHEGSK